MRSSVTSNVALVVLVGGIASVWGCTVADNGGNGGSGGDIFGTAGMAGTTPVGTAGTPSTAGTPGASGSVGAAGTPATGGASTTAGAGGMSTGGTGGVGTAGAGGGSGGGSAAGPITKVWKADGCGKPFTGTSGQKASIMTMGVKDANCAAKLQDGTPRCGAWGSDASTWLKTPLPRDYWVYLPANYDPNKAYPLLFEGPGCGGNGGGVYGMNNIKDQVIRIGISPPNPLIGHGTNAGQGCFDDKEGDDSVDWVFYENLYDKLNADLCFDRNRVFSNGDSSGSWFSNEVGCKYAGDAKRPIRGVLPNTGGLPNQPQFEPTCTTAPMSGIWMHEVGDTENPFSGNKFAIARAMTVNKCTGSTDYDDAVAKGMVEDFKVAGLADGTCKLIKGCPEIYPLVVCPLPGNVHQSHNTQVEAAFPTFLKLFSQGNFLTQ